jgi:hypothetical protein
VGGRHLRAHNPIFESKRNSKRQRQAKKPIRRVLLNLLVYGVHDNGRGEKRVIASASASLKLCCILRWKDTEPQSRKSNGTCSSYPVFTLNVAFSAALAAGISAVRQSSTEAVRQAGACNFLEEPHLPDIAFLLSIHLRPP